MRDLSAVLGARVVEDHASDAGGVVTVRDYLQRLLLTLWKQGEGFSGKRPLGDSGWQVLVYTALVREGLVEGTFDDWGYLDEVDTAAADLLITEAIERLFAGGLYPV